MELFQLFVYRTMSLLPCKSSFPCHSLYFPKMGMMNEVLTFIEFMTFGSPDLNDFMFEVAAAPLISL